MNSWKHPATIIAAIALFVALGGGAFAAVVINGSQIKNHSIAAKKLTASAVKSLHGHPGATYEVKQNGASTDQNAGTTLTLTLTHLPAGAYSIYGKASIDPTETIGGSSSCVLTAGSDTDTTYNAPRTDAAWDLPVQTELTHTFASTGTVTMTCTAYEDTWELGGDTGSGNSEIIAVAAGAAHMTTASAVALRRPASRKAGRTQGR